MKTRFTLAIAFALGMVTFANAQTEPAIKILPTLEDGIVKLMYAYPHDNTVQVKFYNRDGVLASDRVKPSKSEAGFMKKYDLSRLSTGTYWVEISSPEVSVTYKLTARKDSKWIPSLQESSINHVLVASK